MKHTKKIIPGLLFACFLLMAGMNLLPLSVQDPFDKGQGQPGSPKFKSFREGVPFEHSIEFVTQRERYDRRLAQEIRSIDDLIRYAQKRLREEGKASTDRFMLMETMSQVLRRRFYHSYACYMVNDNWIAALAGRLFWPDLAAIVDPDDLITQDRAACSQVCIVLMAALKRVGIPYRKVGLLGHYTMEAFVNNQWYYIDMDVKPNFRLIGGYKSLDDILAHQLQYKLYSQTVLDSADIKHLFSQVTYGVRNAAPAPNALLFHKVTKVIAHWGWIVPFLLWFRLVSGAHSRNSVIAGLKEKIRRQLPTQG